MGFLSDVIKYATAARLIRSDTSGNVTANVNHRTGTVAALAAITGGAGEIGVATDRRAVVLYSGVAAGARILRGSMLNYTHSAIAYQEAIASATLTTLDLITNDIDPGNLWDAANDWITIPVAPSGNNAEADIIARVSGFVLFTPAAATHGTYRQVIVQQSSNGGTTWTDGAEFNVAPIASLTVNTSIAINVTLQVTTFRTIRLRIKHDATGTLDASGTVAVEYGYYGAAVI